MSDFPTAHSPIVIDRVERARGDGDGVRLRLAGHRLTAAAEAELEPLLIVHLHGRRHRFSAQGDDPVDASPGTWEASFTVPDWAVPVEYGQASLWVGPATVPVPPVGTKLRTAAAIARPVIDPYVMPPAAPAVLAPGSIAEPAPPSSPAPNPPPPTPPGPATAYAGAEAGRAGPLADALIRDTVSALHSELEQRSSRETALGIALEQSRAELTARASAQAELEATLAELRAELGRLSGAVGEQAADFERRLGETRERFESELAQEQSKLADGARDLDAVRSELVDVHGEVDRARSELERARAERETTLAELAQARGESDRARAEVAAAREHEAGHAHTRERLADANEQLTAALQSDQLRAQEASSLREQLTAAHISRDAAIAEAGGLRSEISRLGSELAFSREHAGAVGGELGEAQQLLEEARALSAQLRGSAAAD
jgi:hypothetical protein